MFEIPPFANAAVTMTYFAIISKSGYFTECENRRKLHFEMYLRHNKNYVLHTNSCSGFLCLFRIFRCKV